jgi:glycosyl transferase family 2
LKVIDNVRKQTVDGRVEPKQQPAGCKRHTGNACPAISVVIATYNRSRALVYAIESVLGQTFTDWELIVVGDACTDDTAEIVERYVDADSRVRFVNLERNWGEQSAPNNLGRALARAPLIAYLSHDDLWLPHHLKACSEALAATGADLVLGTAANISFEGGRIAFNTLHVLLQGMGEGNRWLPSDLDASVVAASCWLIRTEALDRVGGWRLSQQERAEPSQALLFRLWRRRFHIHTLNDLTLVIVTAGNRPTSYLRRETPEHDWVAEHLRDAAFACELAARDAEHQCFCREAIAASATVLAARACSYSRQPRDPSTGAVDCDAAWLEPGSVSSPFAKIAEPRAALLPRRGSCRPRRGRATRVPNHDRNARGFLRWSRWSRLPRERLVASRKGRRLERWSLGIVTF